MRIHKEGTKAISIIGFILLFINVLIGILFKNLIPLAIIFVASSLFWIFVIRFFRVPKRNFTFDDNKIISPADGKIVTIEETIETEYLNQKVRQISVFMSVWNVHQNLSPITGKIAFYKYHPGLFLLAANPKSSELNERTTIVLENEIGIKILMRQIAGIAARRVICKASEGKKFTQNQEIGFIKFGSRVDLFLPLDAKINVKIGDKVKGGITVIGELN